MRRPQAGCEYFVIDAGWYAELKEDWWDRWGFGSRRKRAGAPAD